MPSSSRHITSQLTGLAEIAADDPEPEFVDINGRNEAVITLQENNHVAIIDLETLAVRATFQWVR